MKKITSLVLLLTFLFMLLPVGIGNNSVKSEVKRKALLELFTATWCGPCAAYGPNADKLYDEMGGDKVILLRNQAWDDGLDTEETNGRCDFYGVTGVPSLFVNGKYQYHPMNYNDYRKKVNEILATQPACAIQLNPVIQSGKNIGVINIDINTISNVNSNNTFLVVALYEKLVSYEGSNKVKTHRFVIRDYIFDELGKKVSLNKGATLSYTFPFILKEETNPQDFGVAAWVQDYSTMEVLQAESKDISILNKPTPPTIVYPEDNARISTLPLNIKWLSPINNYKIQMSDKNDFSNMIADQNTTDDKLTISSLTPGSYFLRIKAIDNSSESDWSKTYKFTYSAGEAIPGWNDYNTNLYGGDVTSIVQDPVNTNVFYTGTYGGGVFKSTDSCKTWVRTSIGLDCLYVNSLTIDNDNPSNIFAGTDRGIYISKDSGKLWYFAWGMSARKIEHVNKTKIIYALSYSSFMKSADCGKTWTQIKLPISGSYYHDDFAIDPQNQNTILVSIYTSPDYIPMLYISVDSGTTWKKTLQLDKYQHINSIAVDNNHNIYLATSGRGLLKSTDNGNTFNKTTTQFNYVYSVSVSLVNPDIVGVTYGSVYISLDGGNTFKRYISGNNVTFDRTKEERIMVGSTAGITISEDKGNTWKEQNTGLTSAEVVFVLSNPSILAQTQNGLFEYSTTWKNLTYYELNKGQLFQNPKKPEQLVFISSAMYISNNAGRGFSFFGPPQYTYIPSGVSSDVDFESGLVYSILYDYNEGKYYPCKIDFNGNYDKITTMPTELNYPSGVIITKDSPSTIYLGAELYWDSTNNVVKGGGLYRSLDEGKTWNLISLKDESIYSMFSDPKNSKVMYANTGSGLQKSTDGGLSWKVVLPQQVSIMKFHNTESIIYATNGRNVLKSKDDGNTWNFIPWDYSVDLVKFSTINSIAIDKNDFDSFFLGTDSGIYKYDASNIVEFSITALARNGGTISPYSTITVNAGESKTFTITPNAGYKIKDVKVDGVSVGAVSTYTFENITMDHTIEAIFEPMTYTISASASGGGSISPSGTVTVDYGESKTFKIIPDSGYKITNVKVDGVSVGAVSTYTFSNVTSDHKIEATFEKEITETVIILHIGDTSFTVNGVLNQLDSPPIIKNGRTLLPIRAIVESLGGAVEWLEKTETVVIILGSNSIRLQIGNANALVNGQNKLIEPQNLKVFPEIVNGRTMLPLRFVAENLGCDVQWDGDTKTITITYIRGSA